MAQTKKLFSKVAMIVFLVLVVLGFTIPGFLNNTNNTADGQPLKEPRVCRNDAECYLLCDEIPVPVLCSQNQCQQNSCRETAPFPYLKTPYSFSLELVLEGKKVSLEPYLQSQDFFVKVVEDQFQVFTFGLPLPQVLEKAQVKLDEICLTLNNTNYCQKGEEQLRYYNHGNESSLAEVYVPQEGDVIKISYP